MHYHALSQSGEITVVSLNQAGPEKVIVVKPNHSATWRQNLWLLAALAVPSLGAGIAFRITRRLAHFAAGRARADGTCHCTVLGELEAGIPARHPANG